MSHTPWLGVAMARFCRTEDQRGGSLNQIRSDLHENYAIKGFLVRTVPTVFFFHIFFCLNNKWAMYYPASVLQDGGWQHPARHFSHVIFHLDPKFLNVWVQVEVSVLHLWRKKDIHQILQKTKSHTVTRRKPKYMNDGPLHNVTRCSANQTTISWTIEQYMMIHRCFFGFCYFIF